MSKKVSDICFLLTYHQVQEQSDYLPTTVERYFEELKKAERFIENLKKDKYALISYRLEKITLVKEYNAKNWTKN